MNKYAVFDLEIVKTVEGIDDWFSVAPLGVSCLAVALSDSDHAIVWSGDNELGKAGTRAAVAGLQQLSNDGYTLVGFNSLGFDLRVLAQESGIDCRELAKEHIDIFFHLFSALGYAPGLDRLAKGMGLSGKTTGVDGAKAPEMWRQGQRQQVIDYCVQDVRTTLALVQKASESGGVQWISKAGKSTGLDFDRWLTVKEAIQLPEPDTSWMKDAWKRDRFTGWLWPSD